MTSQPPKYRECKVCGKRYRYTNYTRRRGYRDLNGRLLRDSHEIACAKKETIYYLGIEVKGVNHD